MILAGALFVFLSTPVVGLQPRPAAHRPKVNGTWVSHVPEGTEIDKIGHSSSSAKMVSISAAAGLARGDVAPSINSVWADIFSQAVHVDAHRSATAVEDALYLGQSGSNVSGTLLAIEWTVIVVLLIVIALLIRNIIEKRSARLSEEYLNVKDQTAQPARESVAAWTFGMQAVRLQHGNPEPSQPRVDLPSYGPRASQQNVDVAPMTGGAVGKPPQDRCGVFAEDLRAEVAALTAPEVERRLQDIEASVADAEVILVSGGGASENLWRVLKVLRMAGGPHEKAGGCQPMMLSPPHPSSLWSTARQPPQAVTTNLPNSSACPVIERPHPPLTLVECQPDSASITEPSSRPAESEGPLPDIHVANVASTVVTLSGNPSTTLNGVYVFQGWLCQRPVFANGEDGVLYHDGEHWKARAGAVPPGQAAAAVSFAAWIRSSGALPPEGDWLNFAESGNVSSITHVSVSIRGLELVGTLPLVTSARSPEMSSDLAKEGAHDLPAELTVVSPTKQVAFAGRYKLVLNQNPNGYPLWKHNDHERYLYSGVNGKWHFGANPEKEKGFFCSRGFVLHPSKHNGVMPSRLPPGEWKAYNGITHETDPSIEVNEHAGNAPDACSPLASLAPLQVVPHESKNVCLPSRRAADFSARPEPRGPPSRAPAPDGPEPTGEPAALSPDRAGRAGRPPRP